MYKSIGSRIITNRFRFNISIDSVVGVEYMGNIVSVSIFPAGIDVENVKSLLCDSKVMEKLTAYKEMFPNKKIILGRFS